MTEEIKKQIQMTYMEQCQYLQKKYGLAKRDYFPNEKCRSKTKNISRTEEGLVLHHNAEAYSDGGNLSIPQMARMHPFEYQKKENLSYCNFVEHLLFHLKMNVNHRSCFEFPYEVDSFFNSMGFDMIGYNINTLYANRGSHIEWLNNCYLAIKDLFQDYVDILRGLLCFLDENYVGNRNVQLIEGTRLYFGKQTYTVRKVNKDKGIVCLEDKIGLLVSKEISEIEDFYNFRKKIEETICTLSIYEDGNWDELEILLKAPFTEEDKAVAKWLKDGIRELSGKAGNFIP